jgi:hypothetical protein
LLVNEYLLAWPKNIFSHANHSYSKTPSSVRLENWFGGKPLLYVLKNHHRKIVKSIPPNIPEVGGKNARSVITVAPKKIAVAPEKAKAEYSTG